MQGLAFSMSGTPRPKLRPRLSLRGHAYTDQKTREYEESVTRLTQAAMNGHPPFKGALSVSIRFRMPIPRSESRRVKEAMAAGEIAHVVKPDADNLTKAILDGAGVDAHAKRLRLPHRVAYESDSQITRLFVTKVYAERPGVDVRIEALEPQGRAP